MDAETYEVMKDYLVDSNDPEQNDQAYLDPEPIYLRLPYCQCNKTERICQCCILYSGDNFKRPNTTTHEYCARVYLDLKNFTASLTFTNNKKVFNEIVLNGNKRWRRRKIKGMSPQRQIEYGLRIQKSSVPIVYTIRIQSDSR